MELFALAFACIIGPLRGFSAEHWTLITIGSVMVLMAELFNSAIERLLQLCHPREDGAEYSYPDDVARSEVVRATYDISAAAVCVALTFTGLVLLHAIIWPTGSVF
jgi:diacylglycerol kinase